VAESAVLMRAAARAQLHKVYTEHIPQKLHAIEGLLDKWVGSEAEILAKVEAKYLAPPTSKAEASRVNARIKAFCQRVQQKAMVAGSWAVWADDMRATVPAKLWPLPGEVLALSPDERDTRQSEAGTIRGNYRFEAGGAVEWVAVAFEGWLAAPPDWFTDEWRAAVPSHFMAEVGKSALK
jgi:hypothetical protein